MNQSLVVYWTKKDTFWPLSPRESFIILGSQIVPDNNHVVLCHVIICSGQSRRYCVKLGKVDNIGSTNLIITRGSRLKQKENKWWVVFSVFWASASRQCLEVLFGVNAWGLCLGSMLGVSPWGLFFGFLLRISVLVLCLVSSFGSLLSGFCIVSLFCVSVLCLCFVSLFWVSALILSLGSLLWDFPSLGFSYVRSLLSRVFSLGLTFGFLLSISDLCIGLLI